MRAEHGRYPTPDEGPSRGATLLRTTQAEYEKNGSEERTGGRRLATYWAGFARTWFAEGRRSGLREGMRGEWRIEDEIFGKRIEELLGLGVEIPVSLNS